jgi:ribonuclease HI
MIIHCDGSCYAKDKRMGVGVAFFEDDSLTPFKEDAITIAGEGTSNEAEYHAIINALRIILSDHDRPHVKNILINTDSQLVYNQIIGEWQCRTPKLETLLKETWRLLAGVTFPTILFNWVPRESPRQKIVDKLSKFSNPYFQEKQKK